MTETQKNDVIKSFFFGIGMIHRSREQRMVICNSIISALSFCVLSARGVKESSRGARFAMVTEWGLHPKSFFQRGSG